MNSCNNCRYFVRVIDGTLGGGICENRDDKASLKYLCDLWSGINWEGINGNNRNKS